MPIDITDQSRRVQYVISGTGPYDFDFEVLAQTDIAVYRDSTLLALTTDYTVALNSDGTGAVTLVAATGTTLTIIGARPYRRITDYATGGDFKATTLNDELDSLQIQILQLVENFERTFAVGPTSALVGGLVFPDPGAGEFIRWNLAGTALETADAVYALGDFLASGAGAVARPAHGKIGEVVSITDFGAVGGGVVDDTAAIRAAIASLTQTSSSFGSTLGSGSKPQLFFPSGKYKVTADLSNGNVLNYVDLVGENAILEVAAGVTCIGNIKYMVNISGITFRGGAKHLALATANVDTNIINVDNCEFIGATTCAVNVDATSQSTVFNITRTKFFDNVQDLNALSCDYINMRDVWSSPAGATPISVGSTGVVVTLTMDNFCGVPTVNMTGWIDAKGGSRIYLGANARFGGEAPVPCIVRAYNSADQTGTVIPTVIDIQSSQASCTHLIKFYAIPNIVRICGTWSSDQYAFHFDSTIPAADLDVIGTENFSFTVDEQVRPIAAYAFPVASTPIDCSNGIPLVDRYRYNTSTPNTADLVLQSAADTVLYGPVQSQANVTVAYVNDDLGVASVRNTATANDASCATVYTTALNGLADGTYTAVFDVTVLSEHVVWPKFIASRTIHRGLPLELGHHTVCVPFYFDGSVESIGIQSLNLPNGAIYRWERFRVYAGLHDIQSKIAMVQGSAAPVSGRWYVGDLVKHTVPVSNIGWVCTTAGSPGTWKAYGTISGGVITEINVEAPNVLVSATQPIFIKSTDAYAIDKGGGISFGGLYSSGGLVASWATVSGRKENANDGDYAGYMQFATRANGFTANEAMRITSEQRVLINKTTSDGTNILQVNGGIAGTNLTASARVNLGSFTVGTLPAAGAAGGSIYVSDAGGNGPCMAVSNGTNWKRCDNVSTTVV